MESWIPRATYRGGTKCGRCGLDRLLVSFFRGKSFCESRGMEEFLLVG